MELNCLKATEPLAVYFLPVSFQEFLVVIESTLVGWNAVLTLEPPNGLELGTLRLGMHCFNH